MAWPAKPFRWARRAACCQRTRLRRRLWMPSIRVCYWWEQIRMIPDRLGKRPVNILIAEDSPTQAELLKHTLERQGYRATVAVNGRQAIETARAHKPTML